MQVIDFSPFLLILGLFRAVPRGHGDFKFKISDLKKTNEMGRMRGTGRMGRVRLSQAQSEWIKVNQVIFVQSTVTRVTEAGTA